MLLCRLLGRGSRLWPRPKERFEGVEHIWQKGIAGLIDIDMDCDEMRREEKKEGSFLSWTGAGIRGCGHDSVGSGITVLWRP